MTTLYERLGGEETIRRLVTRFYDLMAHDPEGDAALQAHGPSLDHARLMLFEYLTGWTGGPPLFVNRRGAPMLRARHLPFKIGSRERDAWLYCFRKAWHETVKDDELTALVLPQIERLADHMRNQHEQE